MPWRDWQFWIVTLLAIWGLWMIAKPFLPRLGSRKAIDHQSGGACPNCASGSASAKKSRRRVALTIERRRIG